MLGLFSPRWVATVCAGEFNGLARRCAVIYKHFLTYEVRLCYDDEIGFRCIRYLSRKQAYEIAEHYTGVTAPKFY